MPPRLAFAGALALSSALACATLPARPDPSLLGGFSPLPLSRQIALREEWLEKRHALLLPLLRKHGISLWIVVNEEFHDDPVTAFVAPPRPYAGGRDLFLFLDSGEAGLRRIALSGYFEESLGRFFEVAEDPKPAKEALAQLVAQAQPKTIALSIDGQRGVTRSLTRASYRFLVEALGAEVEQRFVPAEPLLEELLDTRLPEEAAAYPALVRLTEALARRALSNEVIRPGLTTVGDVRRFLYDELGRAGVTTWFQPDLRVQRKGASKDLSRGFLAVAREATVIERGDLVHLDFGVTHLGLNTDWQRMAYVLREGELAPPPGLQAGLARTNAVQEALMQESRPGRPAPEVWEAVMARAKAAGIEAQVYSHPLGLQGHGLGATIDLRSAARKDAPKRLRAGSWLAMELNSKSAVPEWGGQQVYFMEEDPVWLSPEGWVPFLPRQTELYVVR